MATKYGRRKKHNAGTIQSSTSNKTGYTRKTVTVKSGGSTRSRSRNPNGTIKTTTTRKTPAGIVRTSKTTGSVAKAPKAPKFVKVKPFKAPKLPKPKTTSSSSSYTKKYKGSTGSTGSSGRSASSYDNSRNRYVEVEEYDESDWPWHWYLIIYPIRLVKWLFKILWYFSLFVIGSTIAFLILGWILS